MATINLDTEKILSISNELNSLDETLLNSYVPELKDIISQIKSNVLNDQVNSILGTISSQVDQICGGLIIDLPRLEQFLETQMQSYQTSEADAEAKLQSVVNAMGGFAGVQPVNINNSSPSTTQGEQQTTTQSNQTAAQPQQQAAAQSGGKQPGRGEKYVETWSSWWGDVSTAYSDTHGLFSAVGNTAEVVCDTAGALVETVANGASDLVGWCGDAISWIFG